MAAIAATEDDEEDEDDESVSASDSCFSNCLIRLSFFAKSN